MNKLMNELEPGQIWAIFDEITQIPRPSEHEEKIRDYVEQFGRNLGLETVRDETGNIIIRKPAMPGMENRKGVILQGHLDMVPQKNNDKEHDFEKDPIETIIDGEWVKANGTTLGSDNGIGVSAILAMLASGNIPHGPLEGLFTATEETGMDGANGLMENVLQGEILINLDSEEEGELYVGCAGGEDMNARFSYKEKKTPKGYSGVNLSITGLKGGHSGLDINMGRGNANKIFFRILGEAACKLGVRLSSVSGGNLRNAIPREAFGLLAIKNKKIQEFVTLVDKVAGVIKTELAHTEPDLTITLEPVDKPASVINRKTQKKLTKAIIACPNDVIRMSDTMAGLVETSTNLAIVKSDEKKKSVRVACLMRSSVDSAKKELGSRMVSLFTLAGARVAFSGAYPGWKPNMDSPILKTMMGVYKDKYGKLPEIRAIHAGLECGILGGKYPHWDMISLGPTIRHPHSPDEKVNIPSVGKFWDFLLETMKHIPEKDS
jgi:dipeptidase D